MSIRALDWAWRQECVNPQEKLVLLALADHAGQDGTCYPATGSIAEKCQMSAQSVRRHLTALEARGVIEKIERRRRKDGTLSVWIYGLKVDQSSLASSGPVITSERSSHHQCALGQSSPVSTHEPSISKPSINRSVDSSLDTHLEVFESWESSFFEFWDSYPRKTGKKSAMRRWRTMSERERRDAVDALASHVDHWHRSGTEQQFIPHAATWLNGRRWEDELQPVWQPAQSLVKQVARFALEAQREDEASENSRRDLGYRSLGAADYRLD
jgi:DNA-binding transcriptional ArsR family regulator